MTRGILSKDRISVPIYLQAFHDHIVENNIYKKTKILYGDDNPRHLLAEEVDSLLMDASRHAENQCRKQYKSYWSVDLHILKQKVAVYYHLRRRLKKNLSVSALIS